MECFGPLIAHIPTKNCPKAWNKSFKHEKNNPFIVFDEICNHHTFFSILSVAKWELWMITTLWICLHPDTTSQMNSETLKKSNCCPICYWKWLFPFSFLFSQWTLSKSLDLWRALHNLSHRNEVYKMAKSMQKEIEGAFGILKLTWRFRKNPIE